MSKHARRCVGARLSAVLLVVVGACLGTAATSAMAADHLTPADAATLTQHLTIISNDPGWLQASVDVANSILMKNTYSHLAWDEYFTGYFSTRPYTTPLESYLGYPVFWWSSPTAQLNLQKGLINPLMTMKVRQGWDSAIAAGPKAFADDPVGRLTMLNSQMVLANMGTQPRLWSEPQQRQRIYEGYRDLLTSHPEIFRQDVTLDPGVAPYYATLRAQTSLVMVAAADTADRTRPAFPAAVKAEMATAMGLTGDYASLWNQHSVLLLDNNRCDAPQRQAVMQAMDLVPAELHNLSSITIADFLGNNSQSQERGYYFHKPFGSINIFSTPVGSYRENSFPADVTPGMADGFVVCLAHELNHVVDGYGIQRNPALAARKQALITAAGSDPMNYLRSMFEPGFFQQAPQEFFASMGNEWFTDSAKTIELGLTRFDAGRVQPINQALFFAEVYSLGGEATCFYGMDGSGILTRQEIPLGRNTNGFINELTFDGQSCLFDLDAAGNVLGYQIVPLPSALPVLVIGSMTMLRRRRK